jgi:ribulose-5-phosphate 4-epimerase/fuculose-1-phosphate aldolase
MNYTTDFKSMRGQVSAEEWRTRVDLAACYRLVDVYGMIDLIYNHITARIPGSQDHLLINLYGMLYKEITASSLVKIDVEGEIIWKPDTDYGINKSGYVIHGAIHKARPDVACVLHTHTRAGIAVSVLAHAAHLYQPGTRRPYGVLEWPAMLRLLEAENRSSGYPPYWH